MAIRTKAEIFNESIFKEGFKNDVTPLDEDTLNLLVDGIRLNDADIQSITSNLTTVENSIDELEDSIREAIESDETLSNKIDTEIAERQKANKALNKKIWGRDTTPTSGDTVITQIENVHKYVTGLSTTSTTGDYANSNEKIRADLNELTNQVSNIIFPSVIEIIGGGAAEADPESFPEE